MPADFGYVAITLFDGSFQILRLSLDNPILRSRNPPRFARKSEIQNPKFETIYNVPNPNAQNTDVLNFENLNFALVSDFDIRISKFPCEARGLGYSRFARRYSGNLS